MLNRLAVFTVRRPKVILIVVLALLGISIVFGGTVTQKLGVGGFTDPAAESAQVADFLDQNFPTTPNLVLEVIARDGTVENPKVAAAADRVRQLVEAEPTAKVVGSFSQKSAAELRSKDGRSGLVLVHVGGTLVEATKTAIRIIDGLPTNAPAVEVRAGGPLGVSVEIEDRVNKDLVISEAIALPILLAVLVIVFGGLIAAFLPLAIGITSIVTTLLVLAIMVSVTDVSVHALTVATAFGLGLSIDFGLLMVSRFREERDHGKDHLSAIVATVTTAGRTIIFSAATVTLAMSGLLVFPLYFLRSTALTASAVVILSAVSAIVVLPALLALLGRRIDSLAIIRRKVPLSADSVFWRQCAEVVTKRPMQCALPVIAVLLVLGIPFLGVQLAMPDERALPSDSNGRLVAESLRNDYATDTSQAVTLLVRNDIRALDDLAAPVSAMADVARVVAPTGTYERGKLIAGPVPGFEKPGVAYGLVQLSVAAQSDAAQEVVRDIRAKIVDHQVEVGGPTATLIDTSAAVGGRLPIAILLIALATFILLFLFTGSIVVPMKALVLNLLMLSAVLGAMTWIFQDGHVASWLGVTPAPLNLSMVVLLCCIAFSLSVDYEIFLLSRIKEARDAGLSNNDAIVVGLGRVGRIISSAALLLTITLLSFANGLSFMKMFGIGTALAIVIDATLIRGVVVPAFLRVAGDLNWWAPRPLKWLHARIGFSEAPPAAPIPPAIPPAIPLPMPEPPAPVTVAIARTADAASHVGVIPGRHLVANVNGTVIVVAHRGPAPLSPQTVAARRMSALVEIVRQPERRQLASAVSKLNIGRVATVDFGIVMPTAVGLDVYLWGGVTLVLDDGVRRTTLHGAAAPLLVHRSVPVPAVAAVMTVDHAGERPHRTDVCPLGAGIARGAGAVIGAMQAEATTARLPVAKTPRGDLAPTVSTVSIGRVRRADRVERDEVPDAATRPISASPRPGYSPPRIVDEPTTESLSPQTDRETPSSEVTGRIN